jgi:hypothetical protein
MPYTTVVAGTVITASWGNANVRDQVVTPFATAATRTAQVTAPVEGMLSYLADNDAYECYWGGGWVNIFGAWTTYTPTWRASGGGNSVGNGVLHGEYRRCQGTNDVEVRIGLKWGSTTNGGSGFFTFDLPANFDTAVTGRSRVIGPCYILDAGATDRTGLTIVDTATPDRCVPISSAAGLVAATTPQTFATNDEINILGRYTQV